MTFGRREAFGRFLHADCVHAIMRPPLSDAKRATGVRRGWHPCPGWSVPWTWIAPRSVGGAGRGWAGSSLRLTAGQSRLHGSGRFGSQRSLADGFEPASGVVGGAAAGPRGTGDGGTREPFLLLPQDDPGAPHTARAQRARSCHPSPGTSLSPSLKARRRMVMVGARSDGCCHSIARRSGNLDQLPDASLSTRSPPVLTNLAIKVFTNICLGRSMDRLGLAAPLDYARRDDTLAVVRFDHLGRSLGELLGTVHFRTKLYGSAERPRLARSRKPSASRAGASSQT